MTSPSNTTEVPGSIASSPEWRAGTNYPDWMRGKSADEVAQIAAAAMGVVEQGLRTPAPQQSGPVQSYQPQQYQTPQVDPEAYLDGRTGQAMLGSFAQQIQQTYNPAIQTSLDNSAQIAVGLIQQEHPKVFERYRVEVMAEIAKLPMHLRTLDNLRTVVNVVRANHVEDLAHERAKELLAQQEPTLRAGSSQSLPSASADELAFDKLSDDYKKALRDRGLSWDSVKEFCQANGEDPKKWLADAVNMKGLIAERGDGKRGTIL